MSSEQSFRWRPVGGLGEVGMNCMVLEFGRTVIPVDAGILFADENDFGIEAVYPDYTPILQKDRPKYWLITHAHEDHIGAIPALLNLCHQLNVEAPEILAPPFAAALIREKLRDESRALGAGRFIDKIKTVELDSEVTIDDVKVRFIATRHSTPDTCSLSFDWQPKHGPRLRALHTADFKLDPRRFPDGVKTVSIYDVFQGARPDFLFIDSTNSERAGHSVSELEILPGLEKLIREAPERVYLTLFSSNVFRVAEILNVATRCGREVCLAGRGLQTAFRLSQELGLFGNQCPELNVARIHDAEHITRFPRHKQLIIGSGSQGEHRSVLMRLSQGQHPDFKIESGDTVIFSSKTIPGNEKGVSRLINGLLRLGADVLSGDHARVRAGGPVHASGHARREEIREVMNFLKPHHVVPVHGELRQLRSCAEVAYESSGAPREQVHVVENGTELRFESRHLLPGEEANQSAWVLAGRETEDFSGRMLRFDNFLSHSRNPFLRHRKRAAQGGVISALLDSSGRARVEMKGVLPNEDQSHCELLEKWLAGQFDQLTRLGAFRDGGHSTLEDQMAEEMARHVRRLLGVRPFVVVHLLGL